jgi:hypothetical protein
MKNIIILALTISILTTLFISTKSSASEEIKECPMGSAETLVCEVVLCSVGLAIAESRPKCLKVTKKFSIYLATLGFWSKPPSCRSRDQNCNTTGKAKKAEIDINACEALPSETEINSCKAGAGEITQEYCDTFSGADKLACEEKIG